MSLPFPSESVSRRARRLTVMALAVAVGFTAGCARGESREEADLITPAAAAGPPDGARTELRVCADPNNLPFSNDREEGFENRLAQLVADEMGIPVRYTWWAQRRGFIRNTLRALDCDVVMGVPTTFELVLATRPYYRSSYVFLYRSDRNITIGSLDDDVLRRLRIGVHIIGDDYANPPPAHALSNRGMIENVVGYSIFGDYSTPNPPSRLVDAVVAREVDVAVLWGPFAGYFASQQRVPLEIVPVVPEIDIPFLPMAFDISMGVRRGEEPFRDELNAILERRRTDIDALLADFHVPVRTSRRQLASAAGGSR